VAPAADAFALGIEQGPYSPCRPRTLFSTSGAVVQAPQSQSEPSAHSHGLLPGSGSSAACSGGAGTVVADAMRSWLQSSGLPSGSAALEAQLRAALPETYED
jgi:hypothetical protein